MRTARTLAVLLLAACSAEEDGPDDASFPSFQPQSVFFGPTGRSGESPYAYVLTATDGPDGCDVVYRQTRETFRLISVGISPRQGSSLPSFPATCGTGTSAGDCSASVVVRSFEAGKPTTWQALQGTVHVRSVTEGAMEVDVEVDVTRDPCEACDPSAPTAKLSLKALRGTLCEDACVCDQQPSTCCDP